MNQKLNDALVKFNENMSNPLMLSLYAYINQSREKNIELQKTVEDLSNELFELKTFGMVEIIGEDI